MIRPRILVDPTFIVGLMVLWVVLAAIYGG
jgi:hypothetical protein